MPLLQLEERPPLAAANLERRAAAEDAVEERHGRDADVVGKRLAVDLRRTGHFESSSSLVNKEYAITVNNYLGLTTGGMTVDCPHRERRGYGGDGHTSYQFALAHFGVGAYFTKWARDFADVQTADGNEPHTAPTVSGGGGPSGVSADGGGAFCCASAI